MFKVCLLDIQVDNQIISNYFISKSQINLYFLYYFCCYIMDLDSVQEEETWEYSREEHVE